MSFKIFVINPGSTSTKIALFEDDTRIFEDNVFHDSSVLREFPTINDQLDYRMEHMMQLLKESAIDLSGLDAIVARGGACKPIPGGTYRVDDRVIKDTVNAVGGLYHSSMLGVQMAKRIQDVYGGEMFMVDPPIVDELQDVARISGVKGVNRRAVSHALNLKAVAKLHASHLNRPYKDLDLIVCNIDGGISVTAHHHGRMIDGNDAGGGEGPFTPTRMGTMAVTDIALSLWDLSRDEVRSLCSQTGGLSSHFGTSNSDVIHARIDDGDTEAALVWEAMIYQVCKAIGSMATVLCGHVDGIVLTGGLLRFPDVLAQIERRCGFIAPVATYPGEYEHEAMVAGALEVLRGEKVPMPYPD